MVKDKVTPFGRALRAAMIAEGIESLSELASMTGIDAQTLSNLRRGHNKPKVVTASVLAEALHADDLLAIAEADRRRICRLDSCGRSFITTHTDATRATFCSRQCQQVHWGRYYKKGRDRQRAEYEKRTTNLLRAHQSAVEAHCRDCEPLGVCRDSACLLRPVSPLPFIALSAVSARRAS